MNTLALCLALAVSADPGVLPVGADGKPLNFDFETGTLKDWTAEGEAFKDQPIQGDTVFRRRGDMRSQHQGQYWIGGYEKFGDRPQGTLTSVPFKVTHPWASFRIAGGSHQTTYVELIDAKTKQTISRTFGDETESLKPVAIDLTKHQGSEIQIRLVDRHSGGWGHINFDNFLFHLEKPNVPQRVAVKPDDYTFAGQKPQDAAKNMTVPDGFSVKLFAGEPDLHQPIAFCTDDRGRLWVVEAFCYPRRKPFPGPLLPEAERKNGDKILILEDTDGDGTFDKRTVFLEGLNLVSGIEYGFGGLWVGAAPYLMFIPIGENDLAGEPKILLDGWGMQDTHETLNSFIWGPDGWLYGCHGVFTHSRVGKPGAPDAKRVPINAGIWRYHPTKHVFEVFAHGTSNPWGLDYNQYGDFFVEACVIPHLWHIVQGARYERQAGQHFNPYTYLEIPTIAKHRHYVGANPHGGNGRSDSAGGGHAHSGLLCYQGGLWPKEYHGKLFMGNIHGHRINVDVITPKGSGYEGDRNPDFLLSNDRTCIIVGIQPSPDGNMYFCDWSDKQVCHRNEVEIWDRTNGRIFKVVHKDTKPVRNLDLQKLSDAELVKLQTSPNEWMVRHARRILQERSDAHRLDNDRMKELWLSLTELARKAPDESARLRGLWALHATGLYHNSQIDTLMTTDSSDRVRAWAIRMMADRFYGVGPKSQPEAQSGFFSGGSTVVAHLKRFLMSRESKFTPVESLAIASVMQKMTPQDRAQWLPHFLPVAPGQGDHNLVAMYWYTLEGLAEVDPDGTIKLAAEVPFPQLLPLAARRVASIGTPQAVATLVKHLGPNVVEQIKPDDQRLAILRGLLEGLKGNRDVAVPKEWDKIAPSLRSSPSAEVRSATLAVGVLFRDPGAIQSMMDLAADANAKPADRLAALSSVLDAGHNRLGGLLKSLVRDPAMRSAAIRGMARIADDGVPAAILDVYPNLTAAEKRDAIATLASRSLYAKQLLNAVERKAIPAADIPAETIRQMRNLDDKEVVARIATVWGTVRDTPADRKRLIADWTRKVNAPTAPNPDLAHGRAMFAKVCQQCHTLYGVGGNVGPEITGSNRSDLAYLLENMFDPSAVIPKEYAATKLELNDGRVVTGIIKEETTTTLTVATATETLSIAKRDIDKRSPSELSMMPDDLTKQLNEVEIRNLIGYLRYNQQVPLKATAENAKEFFNGKDLTGWDIDETAKSLNLWSVSNGEIIGKSEKGLKRNTFLTSQLEVSDFKLSLKMKLTPNKENSGIQVRSVRIDGGEMRGPQCDAGKGWWGKLYEESGRGLLWKEDGDQHVKVDDWNEYVIEAKGNTIKTWVNGKLCVNLTDDKLSRKGLIGLQMHSGGPMEVRFKELKLEVLP